MLFTEKEKPAPGNSPRAVSVFTETNAAVDAEADFLWFAS